MTTPATCLEVTVFEELSSNVRQTSLHLCGYKLLLVPEPEK